MIRPEFFGFLAFFFGAPRGYDLAAQFFADLDRHRADSTRTRDHQQCLSRFKASLIDQGGAGQGREGECCRFFPAGRIRFWQALTCLNPDVFSAGSMTSLSQDSIVFAQGVPIRLTNGAFTAGKSR